MFNDCWPASLGWAFVDYYLRRKPSYYAFKRLSVPVVGSVDVNCGALVVSNTATEPKAAEVCIHILDMNDGFKKLEAIETSVGLNGYSTAAIDISDKLGENILAVIDVKSEENTYRTFYKTGKLEIERNDDFTILSMDESKVTIKANTYLQAVELEGDYNFSDNYFSMLKGEVKTVGYEKFSDKANGLTVKSYTLK